MRRLFYEEMKKNYVKVIQMRLLLPAPYHCRTVKIEEFALNVFWKAFGIGVDEGGMDFWESRRESNPSILSIRFDSIMRPFVECCSWLLWLDEDDDDDDEFLKINSRFSFPVSVLTTDDTTFPRSYVFFYSRAACQIHWNRKFISFFFVAFYGIFKCLW